MSDMRIKIVTLILAVSVCFPVLGQGMSVILKRGDTLYKISKEYRIPVSDIIKYNNITNPDKLSAGTEIKLPAVYTVVKGDTLYGLSKKFNLSLSEICSINGFDKSHILKIGERIYVPSEKKSADTGKTETTGDTISSNDDILWPHGGKRIPINGKLRGEEILGERGDIIVSVSSGRVVWVAPYRGYGNLIMIESRDKLIFAYGGNEETLVAVGDIVKPGTKIGRMGIDPIEKNAKAYFFVYKEGKPVDPGKAPRG